MAESGTPRVAVPLAARVAAVSLTIGGVAVAAAADVTAPLALTVAVRPDVPAPDAPAEMAVAAGDEKRAERESGQACSRIHV